MIVYSVKAVKRSLRTGTKNPGNIDSISVTVFADISLSLQIQIHHQKQIQISTDGETSELVYGNIATK